MPLSQATRSYSVIFVIVVMIFTNAIAGFAQVPNGRERFAEDVRISNEVRGILQQLEGYDAVAVSVQSGVVTLTGTVIDLEHQNRVEGVLSEVAGVLAIENNVTTSADIGQQLAPAWERLNERIRQTLSFLPLMGIALVAGGLVAMLGRRLARMKQPWDRLCPNVFIADVLRTVIRLVFIGAGVIVALDILNATALLGTLIGAAGIIGLAISFAMRDTIENFIASVLLSVRQPFRPNDTVEINGDMGKVIRLTSRATILLSFEGNHIRIPNATVFKSRIVNFSRSVERRFDFDITIAHGSDFGLGREIAEHSVQAQPFILQDPATSVWIEEITQAGVRLKITGWIDQHKTSIVMAKTASVNTVINAFQEAGLLLAQSSLNVTLMRRSDADHLATDEITSIENVLSQRRPSLDKMANEDREARQETDLLHPDAPEE